MNRKAYFITVPPHYVFLKLIIYLGIPYKAYLDFCEFWNIGKVAQTVYDAIAEDAMKNKTIAKMVIYNRKNLGDIKLRIYKQIRTKFHFPEVIDQLIDGISGATVVSDPTTWKMPEPLLYFLQNYQLREFVENALLIKLPFHKINKYWGISNPVGILHEHFDIYRYFLWNIEAMPKLDLQLYFKHNCTNQFYRKHLRIVGKTLNTFLGEYGLQTEAERKKSMMEIAHKAANNILNTSEDPAQNTYNLLASCCSSIARIDHDHPTTQAEKKLQNTMSSLYPQIKPNLNPSAQDVRNRNREYRFKQLVSSSVKDPGVYHE